MGTSARLAGSETNISRCRHASSKTKFEIASTGAPIALPVSVSTTRSASTKGATEELELAQNSHSSALRQLSSAKTQKPTGLIPTVERVKQQRYYRPIVRIGFEGGIEEVEVERRGTRPANPAELEVEKERLADAVKSAEVNESKAKGRLETAIINAPKAERAVFELQKEIPLGPIEAMQHEYKASLEMRPNERVVLLKTVTELFKVPDFQWGPRSIHVFSKNYCLLKCLWVSLVAVHSQSQEADLSDQDRNDLIEALFYGVREN